MKHDTSIDYSTQLLQNSVNVNQDDRILFLSAGSPSLIRSIANSANQVDVYDLSHSSLSQISDTDVIQVHNSVFPAEENTFDTAITVMPKGRDITRAQIWSAYRALKPGGTLYLAGPTKGGAKSAISDMSVIFGNSHIVTYKKSHRVGAATKPESGINSYPDDWGANPMENKQYTWNTPYGEMPVATMPGVFSWQNLDDGTRFLLESVDLPGICNGSRVLDVGCGCGVIGTLAASSAEEVVMVDDNLLAVHCATQTALLNSSDNTTVIASDVFDALQGERFDLIITNPPFHREFDVDTNVPHRIIKQARDYLNPGGKLIIVANGFLPYSKVMESHFKKVAEINRDNRYVVLEAQR